MCLEPTTRQLWSPSSLICGRIRPCYSPRILTATATFITHFRLAPLLRGCSTTPVGTYPACRYQVVFVFFLTMLSSAIFASLDVVLADPTQIFSILGETVPGAGNFFIAYVVLQAFGKFPGELARIVPLILQKFFLRSVALDTERMKIMEPGTMDYGTLLPQQLVIYLLVLAYSVLHPIISFFGVIYFGIGLVPHSPSPLGWPVPDIPARYIVHTCLADR
eukprot:m.196447 g.196447  ORF g.196447 m.196447 type:complete len:220 (+) comp25056_c0_seq13:1453-2112(+)